VEPQEYDDMMRRMLAIVVHMEHVIDELRENSAALKGFTQRQDGINERLTQAIEGIERTQARIETILQRVVRDGENGRDA
jgi:hypothetical protein